MDPAPRPDAATAPSRPRRRVARLLVWGTVLALLAAGVVWALGVVPCTTLAAQPSCNVAMVPGPTEAIDDLLEVDAPQTWGSEGELVLTTIVVDNRLTVTEYVFDRLDDDVRVLPREYFYPPGRSVQDARVENEILMSDSQLTAKVAALDHVGVDLDDLTAGAEVVAVLPDTPAEQAELAAGDVITAVDGTPVGDADEAVAAIGAFEPGDEVVLTIGEDDAATDAAVSLDPNPEDDTRPYVGVMLRDFQVLPFAIDLDVEAIGGPSAGLMFSLAIVDRLTEQDLTDGRVVAGTGTIDAQGRVGPITGIVQKMVAASTRDEPATVFLVPADNWDGALQARPHSAMTMVPVATLDDAVAALEAIAADRDPPGAVRTGPDGPADGASTDCGAPCSAGAEPTPSDGA